MFSSLRVCGRQHLSSPSIMNTTAPYDHPIFHAHPFYYSHTNALVPGLSDPLLAVILPVLAYWLTSGFFYCLDISNWAWLDRYRIHGSAEISSRNRATPPEVFRAVILQQVFQTTLGYLWLSEAPDLPDHSAATRAVARTLSSTFSVSFLSPSDEQPHSILAFFKDASPQLAYLLYWYLIPLAQIVVAMYVFPSPVPVPVN
jgi:sphinganine C4-monooxygenase